MKSKLNSLLLFLFIILSISARTNTFNDNPIYPKNQSKDEYVISKKDHDIKRFDELCTLKSDSSEAFGLQMYENCKRRLQKSYSIKTKSKLAFVADRLGDMYRLAFNSKEAIKYYKKSLFLKKEINEKGRPYIYTKLADAAYNYGLFALSVQSAQHSLQLSKKIKNKTKEELVVVLFAQNDLGNAFCIIKDWNNSLKHYKNGLEFAKKSHSYYGEALLLNNIGTVYRELHDSKKAISYFKQSYTLITSEREKIIQLQSSNIARILFNISNEFIKLNELDSAEVYLSKAEEMAKIRKENYPMLDIHFARAAIAFKKGNYVKSEKVALKGLEYLENQTTPEDKLKILEILIKIYEKHNDQDQVLKYTRLYQVAKNNFLNVEKQSDIIAMNTKIELKKMDENNVRSLQQKQNEINAIKTKQSKIYIGVVSVFMTFIVFLILWFRKNKRRITLKQTHAENQIKIQLEKIIFLKSKVNTELVENSVMTGESFNEKLEGILHAKLTAREIEVLMVLCKGKNNQEIADELFISVNTVRTHLMKIYTKMDVKNRIQAVKKAENISRNA